MLEREINRAYSGIFIFIGKTLPAPLTFWMLKRIIVMILECFDIEELPVTFDTLRV